MLEGLNLWSLLMIIVSVITLVEVSYLAVIKLRQRQLKVVRGSILLDTCAIMDGRIVDLAKTGIITAEIIIPRSVVVEMQLLADKADHEKRIRARRGLENVRVLKAMDTVSVAIVNDGRVGAGGVDERLLDLARNYDASIATIDFNLNRVAKAMDVPVINVNEIAQVMRAKYFPGDIVAITILQAGSSRNQAVGYLEDGTMVVVEEARDKIGETMKVKITRSLQTEAGRMMFAMPLVDGAKARQAIKNQPRKDVTSTLKRSARSNGKKSTKAIIKAAPAYHSDRKYEPPVKRVEPSQVERDMVKLANSHAQKTK